MKRRDLLAHLALLNESVIPAKEDSTQRSIEWWDGARQSAAPHP